MVFFLAKPKRSVEFDGIIKFYEEQRLEKVFWPEPRSNRCFPRSLRASEQELRHLVRANFDAAVSAQDKQAVTESARAHRPLL